MKHPLLNLNQTVEMIIGVPCDQFKTININT